jgi:hypothetical protein
LHLCAHCFGHGASQIAQALRTKLLTKQERSFGAQQSVNGRERAELIDDGLSFVCHRRFKYLAKGLKRGLHA